MHALILSGALPAVGVITGLVRQRHLDFVGVLVLAGIAVGTVLGLLSGNARLVLVEGSVPTAVFGVLCLGSLWSRRPLIFRFALEFMGAGTPRGRHFAGLWRYPGFRHTFRLFTMVWGVVYLAAVLAGWMTAYGRRAKREGERLAAATPASAGREPPDEPAARAALAATSAR